MSRLKDLFFHYTSQISLAICIIFFIIALVFSLLPPIGDIPKLIAYPFWLFLGVYAGVYWSIEASKYNKKKMRNLYSNSTNHPKRKPIGFKSKNDDEGK